MLHLARIRLAWLAVAMLLAARALVPMGWMPVADTGRISIELCTGQGAITATLDAQGGLHKSDGAPDQKRDSCPFGLVGMAAGVPAAPVLAVPLPPAALAIVPLPMLVIVPAAYNLRPPGHAPPLNI